MAYWEPFAFKLLSRARSTRGMQHLFTREHAKLAIRIEQKKEKQRKENFRAHLHKINSILETI